MYGRWLLKHGGFDSSVYYLRAIIQFHRYEYDVGTRHPVGNFMRKHFMTELGFTEEGNGSKRTQIHWKDRKDSKTFISQPMAHNLQNVPNGMK